MAARISDAEARSVLREHGAEALEPYPGAHSPWAARCLECGSDLQVRLAKVRARGSACGVCGVRKKNAKRRDKHAPVAVDTMRAAGLEPLEDYPGALKPWLCRCTTCGREVTPRYANVQQEHHGCSYCAERKVDPEHAVQVMRAAEVEPLEPYPGNQQPWRCLCLRCGKEVTPRYASVNSGEQGACAYCAGHRVDAEDAIERMRSRGLEPLEPFRGTKQPWLCRCMTCGKQVAPAVNSGSGCRYCNADDVDPDEAVAVMLAAGLRPLTEYQGSGPWLCECMTCGKRSTPRYTTVKTRGSKCGYCAGRRIDAEDALDIMLAHDLQPLVPYPGAKKPWRSRCLKCERTVSPQLGHVKNRGSICLYCGRRGPDMAAPSLLYLITHADLGANKVGVARHDSSRLQQHTQQGWEVVRLWPVADGVTAYAAEAQVLAWLREQLLLPPYLSKDLMPQGGWTETYELDAVEVPDVISYIESALSREGTTHSDRPPSG